MATPTAPLAALLAGKKLPLDGDEILSQFVSYVAATGLDLYPAQEEAMLELVAGKHVILNTPTGSGKSLVATAMHFKAMAEGKVSFYTCPIKALVSEKFFALCELFGPDNVGMMTGDATINRDAPIICCTAEILANLALRDAGAQVDYVVMDEFHYYSDRERGVAWQIPLLALPQTTFLLMSATLGETRPIEQSLRAITGREPAVVRSLARPVPLDFEYRETPLHETIADLITTRRYPIYLVNFTQRAAAEEAQNLMSVDFCSKEEKEAIRAALGGFSFDTPYGKEFQRFIRHGIGLHHAGLLAEVPPARREAGADGPAQGHQRHRHAGRRRQHPDPHRALHAALQVRRREDRHPERARLPADRGARRAQGLRRPRQGRRAGARARDREPAAGQQAGERQEGGDAQAAEKGYVHWDKATFERLTSGTPEPLVSRFAVTHGMLLNVLQSKNGERGGGYRRLTRLMALSHAANAPSARRDATPRPASGRCAARASSRSCPYEAVRGRLVEVSQDLQRDFSLNQTLSLYLLETLELLDPQSETYALDVLTLVESILENPDVVLYRQLDASRPRRWTR